jgi:hypothetical protein
MKKSVDILLEHNKINLFILINFKSIKINIHIDKKSTKNEVYRRCKK